MNLDGFIKSLISSLRIILMFMVTLAPMTSHAGIDGVQSALLATSDPVLRWDNIEGPPAWISGVKPVFVYRKNTHVVHLDPGDATQVRLPSHASLRVRIHAAACDPENLVFSISNGSGFYVSATPRHARDGHDLVLSPESRVPLLVHIRLSNEYSRGVPLSLYMSRYETPGSLAPYRGFTSLDLERVWIKDAPDLTPLPWYRLNADSPTDIDAVGPLRMALETRLVYLPGMHKRLLTYPIFVRIDDKLINIPECPAMPEARKPAYVSGHMVPLGRTETVYINIPEGRHTVTIRSPENLTVRLLAQTLPDYFARSEKITEPLSDALSVYPFTLQMKKMTSLWNFSPKVIIPLFSDAMEGNYLPDIREYAAQRIMRDNRRQDGGLVGAMLFLNASKNHPNDFPAQYRAEHFLGRNTTFRNLYPASKSMPANQHTAFFSLRTLKEKHAPAPYFTVAEQHMNAVLNTMPEAGFVDISDAHASLTYQLPERFSDSYLRICVDTDPSVDAGLTLQFDDHPAARLQVQSDTTAHTITFRTPDAENLLSFLATDAEKFSDKNRYARKQMQIMSEFRPQIKTCEIFLPRHVRTITLHRVDTDPSAAPIPMTIALQYRTAVPYHLSETQYLKTVGTMDPKNLMLFFLECLLQFPGDRHAPVTDETVYAETELLNHWQPLLRLLSSHRDAFKRHIQPRLYLKDTQKFSQLPDAAKSRDHNRQKALQYEKESKWITAFETWTDIFHRALGKEKEAAWFAAIKCLRHLGERFLAEQMLKESYWYSRTATSHTKSFNALASLFLQEQDIMPLISLYTAELAFNPTQDLLNRLCTALLSAGYDREGIMLGMIIPASSRPVAPLLDAAFGSSLWQIHDLLLKQVDDENTVYFRQGLQAANQGDYQTALARWRLIHNSAGTELPAAAYADALKKGLEIRAGLKHESTDIRAKWILEWEKWQARHPGPFTWENADFMIRDYAGTHLLYAVSRDISFQTWQATPETPVSLEVMGPVKLKFTARPLHARGTADPLNGWITITKGKEHYVTAVNRNLPSSGIRVSEDDTLQAGSPIEYELDIGPGIHDITVNGNQFPILLQVDVRRPVNSLNILPLLTVDTAHAALKGIMKRISGKNRIHRILNPEAVNMIIIPENPDASPFKTVVDGMALADTLKTEDRHLYRQTLTRLDRLRLPQDAPMSDAARKAEMLANNDIEGIFSFMPRHTAQTALYDLTLLVWIAEHFPEKADRTALYGETLYQAYSSGQIPGLKMLYNRLTRHQAWKPVKSVESSAGWRYMETQGWQPESDYLRVRKALMGPVRTEAHVLYDRQHLILATRFFEPTDIRIDLTKTEITALPDFPMTIRLQVDDQPADTLTCLKNGEIRSVRKKIPAGEHTITIRITEKYENQFLRCVFYEYHAPTLQKQMQYIPIISSNRQAWLLATRFEPVRLAIEGPEWIRIDEYHPDGNTSQLQYIPPGWHNVTISPRSRQGNPRHEAMVRIFRKISRPDREKPEIRFLTSDPAEIAPPLFRVEKKENTSPVMLTDGFSLGGQEDGTWGIEGGIVIKNNYIEEDTEEATHRHLELAVTYRYFQPEKRTYYRAGVLQRTWHKNNPSFGMTGSITRIPSRFPLNIKLGTQVYGQKTDAEYRDPWAWSVKLDAGLYRQYEIFPKIHHTPSVTVFTRHLSLDETPQGDVEDIDPDVYSTYKNVHRNGIQMGETLLYKPWLDMLLFCGGGMASNDMNSGFDMDHIFFNTGWRQLLGSIVLSADTRYKYYVNDEDRLSAHERFMFGLGLVWQKWLQNQHRMTFRTDLAYDIHSNDLSARINVALYFGKGRGFRDFLPGEIDFQTLQKQKMSHRRNNFMNYEK